jgi:recombination protein RecA
MAKKEKIKLTPRKEPFMLRSLIQRINNQYGEGTILLASEAKNLKVEFFSSGCFALDFITGGGIPLNRITQFVGAYSSCKTTLTLTAIREFQKKYPDGYCGFIDVELALDFAYAEALGVDLKRMLVVRPDSGEQAVDVLMEVMKQDVPLLMAIDSIPAIIPMAEMETTIEQNFMGKHPQLINRMVKMCNARLKKSLTEDDVAPTVVIMLNQIREKIGVVFGNPETTPGGRGKDFFSGIIVTLRGGEKEFEELERGKLKKKFLIGREFNAQVTKNKCGGRPFEETKFSYYTKNTADHPLFSFNNEEMLFEFGLFHDLIDSNGKFKLVTQSRTIIKGREKEFVAELRKYPKVADVLYHRILRKLQELNSKTPLAAKEESEDDEPTATLVESDDAPEATPVSEDEEVVVED